MYIYTRILGHEKGFPSPSLSPDFVIMAGRIFLFSPDSFPFSTPAASRNSYRLRFHFLYLRRCLPAANNADTPDTLIISSAHLVSPSLLLSRRFSPLASIRRPFPSTAKQPLLPAAQRRIPSFLYSARDAYVCARKQNLSGDFNSAAKLSSSASTASCELSREIGQSGTIEGMRGRKGESSVHQLEIAVHSRGNRQVSPAY